MKGSVRQAQLHYKGSKQLINIRAGFFSPLSDVTLSDLTMKVSIILVADILPNIQ